MQALVIPTPLPTAPVEGQVGQIVFGVCDDLGSVVADLGIVQTGQGASVGVADAPAVAQGYAVAPISFAALTDTPHAVAVFATADADDAALACGTIGGQLTDTGALVIALEASIAGGPNGVAVLAPTLENPDATGVSIFLRGLTSGASPAEAETVSEEDAG